MRWSSWLGLVAAGGCHGNHARTADAPGIDAPTVNVELQVTGSPQLIEYRNGSGAWQVPVGSGSSYTLEVTNDYEYIVVCTSGGAFDSEEYGATVADGSPQQAACFPRGPGPTLETVTGTVAQAGSVEMYGEGSSTTPNWTFSFMAPMGLNDLVVWDTTSMLIHRNVPVTGSVSVGHYDLSTSGTPLQTATLTIENLGSDGAPSVGIAWNTANDQAFFPGSGAGSAQVIVPPAALVEATDLEQVSIATFGAFPGPSTSRSLNVDFSGTLSTTDYTLPAMLTGVSFDTSTPLTSVTWGQLPAGATQLTFELAALTGVISDQRLSVTPAWVAATASTSLSLDMPSDGYVIDTTQAYGAFFYEWLDTPTTSGSTAFTQAFNVGARAEGTTGPLGDRWLQLQAGLRRHAHM